MAIFVGGLHFLSLLALALIGSAILHPAASRAVRATRTQTPAPASGSSQRDRGQNHEGMPCAQAETALKETNNAMNLFRQWKNCSFLPPEIIDSPNADQLFMLLSGVYGVTSVEFMQQLELFRMLMREVGKNRLLRRSPLPRLVEKVRDLQRNLTSHCEANSSTSGRCEQPDDVTRTLGNISFVNSDNALEAGACVLDLMNASLSNAKLQLCAPRTRRGSSRVRQGRQQGKAKKNKGKKDESADAVAKETPDVDDDASKAAPRAEHKAKGSKPGNQKAARKPGKRGEAKRKQPKAKKGGSKSAAGRQ